MTAVTAWTDKKTSSDYQGKLIRCVLSTLMPHAEIINGQIPNHDNFCSNIGVFSHGTCCFCSLQERQSQADLLLVFHGLLFSLPVPVTYSHVAVHNDVALPLADIMLPQQINVMIDVFTQVSLLDGMEAGHILSPLYPFKDGHVLVGGKKLKSSLNGRLYAHRGRLAARQLFHKVGLVKAKYLTYSIGKMLRAP
jgi:hypothetical protein